MNGVGDYIVYKKDVCKIIGIKKNYYRDMDYYVLEPITDNSLKIEVPINNKFIRDVISVERANDIIDNIRNINVIECDDKLIENKYKELLATNLHEDLIRIIKTAYLRNKERIDNRKKISDKDEYYFELAEKYLYNEIGIVLNMNYDDTKEYIVNRVNESN